MDSLKLIYEDSANSGNRLDISDIVESVSLSTSIGTQCGRAELRIIGDGAEYSFGGRLHIMDGDTGIFLGYLFSISMQDADRFTAVFYDQTRYLKNVDVLVVKDMTASDLFNEICDGVIQTKDGNSYERKLKKGTVDASTYKLPAEVYEGRPLWDVLAEAIEMTLAYEKKLFIIRDNYGELEFRNVENLQSDFIIDANDGVLGYNLNIGIDKNTFTRARIGYENKDAEQREWGVEDAPSEYIDQWGILQYYRLLKTPKKIDELEAMCKEAVSVFCQPTRDVQITCFGDFRVSAGVGVMLNMEGIKAFEGMNAYYVTSCTHEITNDKHTMTLTLAVSSFGG